MLQVHLGWYVRHLCGGLWTWNDRQSSGTLFQCSYLSRSRENRRKLVSRITCTGTSFVTCDGTLPWCSPPGWVPWCRGGPSMWKMRYNLFLSWTFWNLRKTRKTVVGHHALYVSRQAQLTSSVSHLVLSLTRLFIWQYISLDKRQ